MEGRFQETCTAQLGGTVIPLGPRRPLKRSTEVDAQRTVVSLAMKQWGADV